jgi:hypothetical protein
MKKKKNLIILAIVLITLLGSYLYINNKPKKQKDADNGDDSTSIEILKLNSDDITKMTVSTKDEGLIFEKDGDDFKLTSHPDILIDNGAATNLLMSFSSLYADKIVSENSEGLENYGLKKPAATAVATLKNGTSKTVYLGDKTPGGSSYYFMVNGDKKIYTISSADGDHFGYRLSDIRRKNVFSMEPANIRYVKILKDGNPLIELNKDAKPPSEVEKTGDNSWVMEKPYSMAYYGDESKIEPLLESLVSLSVEDFVEDSPKDLAKYGLDKPHMQLTIKADNTIYNLYIGANKDESSTYFMTDKSKSVYTMSSGSVASLNVNPFDYLSKFACIVSIDNVDKVHVEGPGVNSTLTLTRTKKDTKDKDKDEDKDNVTYKIDGKQVEEKAFKSTYQSIIGLLYESENDKQVPENPEVKVTYTLNKGQTKEITVNYCPYNDDFYAVYKNDKADFLISKSKVKNMLDDVSKLKE